MLLRTKEAAALLGLKPKTLQNWRLEGRGPVWLSLGSRIIRYAPDAIAAWIDSEAAKSTPQTHSTPVVAGVRGEG